MLILLSPSKTLDMSVRDWKLPTSTPALLKDTSELMKKLKALSVKDIQKLMDVSEKIAMLNVERNKAFIIPFTENNAVPALFAFKGDVYEPLEVETYSKAELKYANTHVRSLSGLYGLLRPMDLMQAYRLEMGASLKNIRGKDLYAFWGDRITDLINKEASTLKNPVIVNLASQEYFKAVQPKKLKYPLITPEFKEFKAGSYKIIGIMAKRARGLMTNYAIRHNISDADALKAFSAEGYSYNSKLSTQNQWIFTRKQKKAA
ncbi:MAG: peroxide stress protein YaaA [Rickettsiales bacterium]